MSETRSYVSPTRERRAAATRDAIIEAFVEQLVEGFDALSPKNAAQRAGCSVRTVHGHFPDQQSRVEAVAAYLEERLYPEPLVLPTSVDELPDHYRTIHRAALGSDLATALIAQRGNEWASVRAARRSERLDAVTSVVRSIGAPNAAADSALGILLTLAGGEVAMTMRDQFAMTPDQIPDAIAHTVTLIVDDLTRQID